MSADRPPESPEVILRPFEPGDAEAVHRWFNNKEVVGKLMEQRESFSLDQARGWVERAAANEGEDRKFAIWLPGREQPIGFTALYGLFRQTGCELGVMIGDPPGVRGAGREAERQTCGRAFDEYGAHKVYGRLPAFNVPAKKAVEWMGWSLEGVMREHIRRHDGELVDCEIWGVTRSAWRERWGDSQQS